MSKAEKPVGKKQKTNGGEGAISGPVLIVGGGQMGGVLARHMVGEKAGSWGPVRVVDPGAEAQKALKSEGIIVSPSLAEALRKDPSPSLVVLAVKPGVFLRPGGEIVAVLSQLPPGTLALSVMAGVSLDRLKSGNPSLRWVRAMTNLALSAGKGMTLLAAGSDVIHGEQSSIYALFAGIGRALWLPEESFDAATALAGSGPGLLALVAEALADGGVREGLSRETATLLSSWAIYGAGALMADRGILPESLKSRVASPSGTTIEGLALLEKRGVRGALIEAVHAMAERSRTLSRS
ncbi:MAG: pyrroline-5-carboxylate reductase family protein [Leptospirillia bacterium]